MSEEEPMAKATMKVGLELDASKFEAELRELCDSATEMVERTVMGILRVQPGDVLVVKSRRSLSEVTVQAIKERVERVFPGHEVIVTTGDLSIDVVRPA